MPGEGFHTIVDIPQFKSQTGYQIKNCFMGSCFTENIGNKMARLKYDTDINPFGILYNPISVASGIEMLMERKEFKESDLVKQNGIWHSFYHHGRFSSTDKKEVLEKINNRIHFSHNYLKNSGFLFVTFGTAWVYNLKGTGKTVSNCHKVPSGNFERIRLTIDEIVEKYRTVLNNLWQINPGIEVIFTVSPVRHWKDGAVENQRSKSILLLAADRIVKNSAGRCNYFPAYEIVMDELRDYRYYAEDMVHISPTAVEHIWNKFESALIREESQKLSTKIKPLIASIEHRPIYKYTKEHLNFVKKQLINVTSFKQKYPFLLFDSEIEYVNTQIKEIEEKMKLR